MQQVAHLGPGAAIADIGEPAAEDMARQPEPDEALIHLAHLPRAADDAAAVDDGAERHRAPNIPGSSARPPAWSRHRGTARRRAERIRRCPPHSTPRPRHPVSAPDAPPRLPSGRARSRCDRIDAARRDEHHGTAVAAQMLQAVDRAVEIGGDDIVGAAAIARMDAGLGGAFDQPVGGTRLGQILARTDVAMEQSARRRPPAGRARARCPGDADCRRR